MILLYCFYLFLVFKHEIDKDYTHWFTRLGVGSKILLFIAGCIYHSFQYNPIVHTCLMSINKLLPAHIHLLLVKFKTKMSSNHSDYELLLQDSNSVFREPLIESMNSSYYN